MVDIVTEGIVEQDCVEYDIERLSPTGVNINHFFVAPKNREQGLGTSVLQSILDDCEMAGLEYVVVNMKGGDEAEEFLRKNNFDIEERQDSHVTGVIELVDSEACS